MMMDIDMATGVSVKQEGGAAAAGELGSGTFVPLFDWPVRAIFPKRSQPYNGEADDVNDSERFCEVNLRIPQNVC